MNSIDRTVWIARIFAAIILVVFAVLMMNLYGKLRQLKQAQEERPVPTATSTETGTSTSQSTTMTPVPNSTSR